MNPHDPAELEPERVASMLGSAAWRVTGGGTTGSTNDDAKVLARAGDPGGVAVLASRQTAGRGRFDREWESPRGGVYVSMLLRPPLMPSALGGVPLVAGVATIEALRSLDTGLSGALVLKWPNDVLADGRKLAGILVESAVSGDRLDWLVIGVGVNVQRPSGVEPDRAASLEEFVSQGSWALDRDRIAAALLESVAELMALLVGEGLERLLPGYVELSGDIGREVVVRDPIGAVAAEGTVTGFDAQGRLLLSGPGGPQRVSAGEVTLRG